MKENNFFFFFKFGYAWSTHAEISQEYEYPKSIRYGYGYLCFIAGEFLFKIIPISNDSALLDLFGGTGWLFGFNECVCGMPCIILCVSSYMNMVSKSEQDLA